MTCAVCGTKFYDQTYDSPADPCDCGRNYWTYGTPDEDQQIEIAKAKEEWAAEQAAEEADDAG